MKVNVGIDMGSRYTVVACFREDCGKVEILKNSAGKERTPSVIHIENGKISIGDEADKKRLSDDINAIGLGKSWLGDPDYTAYLDKGEFTLEDLFAKFLAELVKDIEKSNHVQIEGVALTIPVWFGSRQHTAILHAAQMAGLKLLSVFNESKAAIIGAGLSDGADKTVLVYDLGDTFDVSIARVHEGEVLLLAANGDHALGGYDWELDIRNYVCDKFEEDHGICLWDHPDALQAMRLQCLQAKLRLTQESVATVTVQCDGITEEYVITREWLEEITGAHCDRTLALTEECFRGMDEAMDWSDIDEVLPVGGATRMPQIKDMILRAYGKPPVETEIAADDLVAAGAARVAAIRANEKNA